jgi:hypothetical protein
MAGSWPAGQVITWAINASNLAPQDLARLTDPIARGLESWARVCGVRIARYDGSTPEPNIAVVFVADLSVDTTVAWNLGQNIAWANGSELGLTDEPVGDVGPGRQVRLRLNANAAWTELRLEQVTRHEAGHALGCDHAPAGVRSCMSAYLDESVTEQQSWECSWARYYYGPPPEPASAVSPAERGDDRDAAGQPAAAGGRPDAVPAVRAAGGVPDGIPVQGPGPGPVRPPLHADPAPGAVGYPGPGGPAAGPDPAPVDHASGLTGILQNGQRLLNLVTKEHAPMPFLATLLSTSVVPFVAGQLAQLIKAELKAGAPLDSAVRAVAEQLEAKIGDPEQRTQAKALLDSLITFGEALAGRGLDAISGATPAQ